MVARAVDWQEACIEQAVAAQVEHTVPLCPQRVAAIVEHFVYQLRFVHAAGVVVQAVRIADDVERSDRFVELTFLNISLRIDEDQLLIADDIDGR